MTRRLLAALACLALVPRELAAQESSFACNRICWNPPSTSALCSLKLASQYDLTAYIWAVQHGIIAKGKGVTFSLGFNAPKTDCLAFGPPTQAVSVSGYVHVANVTDYTLGGLKVGDVIEIKGTGVSADQRNVMFFVNPGGK